MSLALTRTGDLLQAIEHGRFATTSLINLYLSKANLRSQLTLRILLSVRALAELHRRSSNEFEAQEYRTLVHRIEAQANDQQRLSEVLSNYLAKDPGSKQVKSASASGERRGHGVMVDVASYTSGQVATFDWKNVDNIIATVPSLTHKMGNEEIYPCTNPEEQEIMGETRASDDGDVEIFMELQDASGFDLASCTFMVSSTISLSTLYDQLKKLIHLPKDVKLDIWFFHSGDRISIKTDNGLRTCLLSSGASVSLFARVASVQEYNLPIHIRAATQIQRHFRGFRERKIVIVKKQEEEKLVLFFGRFKIDNLPSLCLHRQRVATLSTQRSISYTKALIHVSRMLKPISRQLPDNPTVERLAQRVSPSSPKLVKSKLSDWIRASKFVFLDDIRPSSSAAAAEQQEEAQEQASAVSPPPSPPLAVSRPNTPSDLNGLWSSKQLTDFDERAILHLQSVSATDLMYQPAMRLGKRVLIRFFERGNALFSRLEEALQVCKGPHVAPLLFSAAAGPADEDRAAGRKEQGGRLYHASLRSCVVTPLPVANLEDELKRRLDRQEGVQDLVISIGNILSFLHLNKFCLMSFSYQDFVQLSDKTWRIQDLSFSLPKGTTLATSHPDIIQHLRTLQVPEVMKAFQIGALGRHGHRKGADAIAALPSIDMFSFGLFIFHAVTGAPLFSTWQEAHNELALKTVELQPPSTSSDDIVVNFLFRKLLVRSSILRLNVEEAMREFDLAYAKEIERRRIVKSASLQTVASIRNEALQKAVLNMPPRMREVLLQSAQVAME